MAVRRLACACSCVVTRACIAPTDCGHSQIPKWEEMEYETTFNVHGLDGEPCSCLGCAILPKDVANSIELYNWKSACSIERRESDRARVPGSHDGRRGEEQEWHVQKHRVRWEGGGRYIQGNARACVCKDRGTRSETRSCHSYEGCIPAPRTVACCCFATHAQEPLPTSRHSTTTCRCYSSLCTCYNTCYNYMRPYHVYIGGSAW